MTRLMQGQHGDAESAGGALCRLYSTEARAT